MGPILRTSHPGWGRVSDDSSTGAVPDLPDGPLSCLRFRPVRTGARVAPKVSHLPQTSLRFDAGRNSDARCVAPPRRPHPSRSFHPPQRIVPSTPALRGLPARPRRRVRRRGRYGRVATCEVLVPALVPALVVHFRPCKRHVVRRTLARAPKRIS